MKIITDSREQLKYWNVTCKCLIVGDYTTKVLENKFHIERKSLGDLYGTLTKGNNRFKYELFRAAYNRIHIEVYIEGTYDAFINKRFPKGNERKFSKEGLERLVSTFQKKYYLTFHWHKNRATCLKAVEKRLKDEEKTVKK